MELTECCTFADALGLAFRLIRQVERLEVQIERLKFRLAAHVPVSAARME